MTQKDHDKPRQTPVQQRILLSLERLEREHAGSERFSLRALEIGAGIPNGTLGKLLHGTTRYLSPPTARRVGALLEIPWDELVAGGTPLAKAELPANHATGRTIARLLDAAWDAGMHRPSDADVVRQFLAHATLIEDGVDLVAIAREWLDAVAHLRECGQEPTTEAVLFVVSRRAISRHPVRHAAKRGT